MNHLSRRTLLSVAALGTPVILVGCATGSTPGAPSLTPAQVISDAASIVNGLAATITQIDAVKPGLIPAATLATIETYLSQAQTSLVGLSASLPATASASVLQQTESYVQSVLTTLAQVPQIPPPYSTAIEAAAVLLPIVEAFVNTTLGNLAIVAAPSPTRANQARATLAAAISRAR